MYQVLNFKEVRVNMKQLSGHVLRLEEILHDRKKAPG